MKVEALLIVFVALIALCSANCPSGLTAPCTCSLVQNPTNINFFKACPIPTYQYPTLPVSAPITDLYDDGTQNILVTSTGDIAYTSGNTYSVITNLLQDVNYEFTTCSRIAGTISGVDTVLVLRDGYGNYLASNDNCDIPTAGSSQKCAYISYTHSGNFNNATLSVYAISSKLNCNYQYVEFSQLQNPKKIQKTPVFVDLVKNAAGSAADAVCNYFTESVSCTSSALSFNVGSSFVPSSFGFTYHSCSSDTNAYFMYSINGSTPSPVYNSAGGNLLGGTWSCANVSTHVITFYLYGQPICSNTFVVNTIAPTILDCAAGEEYYFPIILQESTNYCTFNVPCAFYVEDFAPPVTLGSLANTCDQASDITYTYSGYVSYSRELVTSGDESNYVAFLGDIVTYSITAYNSNGVASSSQYCDAYISGLQLGSLYDYENEVLLYDDSQIFYDTIYHIDLDFSLPDDYDPYYFGLYFVPAGLDISIAYENSYEVVTDGFSFSWYFGENTLEFAIPSDTGDDFYIPPGDYEIVVFYDFLPITFTNPQFPSFHPYNNSKRTLSNGYLISVGNPRVSLSSKFRLPS